MIDSLAAGDGRCDVAVAGLEVRRERLEAGVQYTWPTFQSGLRIMVADYQQEVDLWAFMDAFTWQVL